MIDIRAVEYNGADLLPFYDVAVLLAKFCKVAFLRRNHKSSGPLGLYYYVNAFKELNDYISIVVNNLFILPIL